MASHTTNNIAVSYLYDADGLRTSKTVNGTKHDYYYLDGKLVYEKFGVHDILYYYDSYGTFAGLQYFPNGSNGVMYYAATNMQGDVIGLYDSTGALVVSYEYDAWGKLLSITDTSANNIGTINPIRYRGYYYDSETGLYYLQSRYYDPETCRFINADGYVSTGQGVFGHNPYLYCGNNPIMRVDPTGEDYSAAATWASSMWWLCMADSALPFGDIIYVGGLLVFGIIAFTATQEATENLLDDITSTSGAPMPNNNDDNDDDDDYNDDYYDDESNFGGRQKVGKNKGKTPGNNQAQNAQFKDATKGLSPSQKRILHDLISNKGLGYHEIAELAKQLFVLLVVAWDSED